MPPASSTNCTQDLFARSVRDRVAAGEIAGAAAAVATRQSVRLEAFGFHDLTTRALTEVDTIFRLGSTAKTMFTATALRLIEDKNLRLDADVCEWLPELSGRRILRTPASPLADTVAPERPITLFDVLTFQLGIGIYLLPQDTPILRAMRAAGVAPMTEPVPLAPDEFMSRLAALPFPHQAGEAFMYHTGDDVLRILISRIAGQPLHEVVQERLFEPLSMLDTGTSVPRSKLHRFSTCYYPPQAPGAPLVAWDEPDGRFAEEPIFPNQLMSTLGDFLVFTRMLLDEGSFHGRRILRPESVKLMLTDHLSDEQKRRSPAPEGFWRARGWGMGATVYSQSVAGGPSAGSYSWFGGYGPHFIVDPARGSSVILMAPRLVQSHADTSLGYEFELATYRDVLCA